MPGAIPHPARDMTATLRSTTSQQEPIRATST